GGAMLARNIDKRLLAACKKTNQLTIEVTLTPANLKQRGPARIVTFSTNSASRNFTLGQDGKNLILRLRTTQTGDNGTKPQVTLCQLAAGKPHHIIVSYFPGRLFCYVNGRKVPASAAVQGDFSNWAPQHLLFGDEWNGQRDWSGRLEGVAIYSRFVPPKEAVLRYRLYAARFKKRKPAPRVVLEGKLVETTATPAPGDIAPYRRGLVLYTYEVGKVVSGKCKEKRIQVAHWAILDDKALKSLAAKVKGRNYRLTLERYDDHPQLQGERLITDSNEFDLRRYIDVGPVSP
ncbi:MAG: LamG domain-containing protein, partial [Phycisphaerae bacterium]|nr:LamG domain-containing protein [Phycisphaerae bacterium]